jgi:hypothetical protein
LLADFSDPPRLWEVLTTGGRERARAEAGNCATRIRGAMMALMADEPDQEIGAATYLATDGACPYCRYNLRGLPGDPIRCPECGERVQRAELILPRVPKPGLTPKQRLSRNLQAAGSLCAGPLAAGMLVLVLAIFDHDRCDWLIRPVLCVGVPIEMAGLLIFAQLARGATGAFAALLTYLIAGIPGAFVTFVLISLGFVLAGILGGIGESLGIGALAFFGWITLLVWLRPGGRIARLGASRLENIADALIKKRG